MSKTKSLPFIGLMTLVGLICGLLLYLGLMLGSAGRWEQLSAPEKAVKIVTYSYLGLFVRSSADNLLSCNVQAKVCKKVQPGPPPSLSWEYNTCERSRLSVPPAPGNAIDWFELNYCYDGTDGQLNFVILEDGSIWKWSKEGRTIDDMLLVFALGGLGAFAGGISGAVILRPRSGEKSPTSA